MDIYQDLKSLYYDEGYMAIPPPIPFRKVEYDGLRYYFISADDGEKTVYPSVTTVIDAVLPQGKHLEDWKMARGAVVAKQELEAAAEYGTFMHAEICDFILNNKKDEDGNPTGYDTSKYDEYISDYCRKHTVVHGTNGWKTRIANDMLAFAQFVAEKNVTPIAVEIILGAGLQGVSGKTYTIAGCLDLVCELDFGQKRVLAIIDLKSGRKGFYNSHELQLAAYKELWDANFPEKRVEMLFNWSPKEWRKSPTYNFKNQTDSAIGRKLSTYLDISEDYISYTPSQVTVYAGVIEYGNYPVEGVHYTNFDLQELL